MRWLLTRSSTVAETLSATDEDMLHSIYEACETCGQKSLLDDHEVFAAEESHAHCVHDTSAASRT